PYPCSWRWDGACPTAAPRGSLREDRTRLPDQLWGRRHPGRRRALPAGASALASGGADCELLTFGHAPAAWRDPSGLRVRVLRARRYLGGHPAHPLAPDLVAALRGADLVHVHQMYSAPGLVAALSARLRGQRTAVTDHGLLGPAWGG